MKKVETKKRDLIINKTIHLDVDFTKETTFVGRSVEDGLPVTKPIYNVEELFAWMPDDDLDRGQPFSVSSAPYYGKDIAVGSPKTLVCHDMSGGYLDDRFVQGKLCTDEEWYYLAYWDIIDIFVYFSHHFVTIPPVGWINSAHRNGVAVLGTFITEGNDGFKRCDAIFGKESIWKHVADQLVNIAKFYKFEGWLLNIENGIRKEKTKSLQDFVKYLTDKMHDAIEGSQVIWYDSVTDDGVLDWQNQLNSRNKVYFDGCDGIFLNYTWGEVDLKKSAEVGMVERRVEDVYVGVDVFGRGCYGGGGMNSGVAVELIGRYSLSTAIFAPGWVKEVLGAKDFEKNQAKFWTKLAPYCLNHAIILPHPYFHTHFHPGIEFDGSLRFLHLNRQSYFPNMSSAALSPVPVSLIPHEVIILKCSDQLLFKVKLPPKHSEPGKFQVYVTMKNPKITSFDVTLKCQSELDAMSNLSICEDGKVLSTNCCSIEEILCSTSDSKVEVQKFILVRNPVAPDVLSSNWSVDVLEKGRVGIDLSVDDVSWKKPGNGTDILFSCTLMMEGIDVNLPVTVFHGSLQSQLLQLGVAYCSRYRIHELPVPDPVHYGPNTKIFLKAKQENTIPSVLCQTHGLAESKYGKLEITYGERTSGPIYPGLS